MSTVSKYISPEEYLLCDRQNEFRSEYYRGEMFAMAGGSWDHNGIKDNFARVAGNRLIERGKKCELRTSDQRVKVDPTGLYTYPDIVVVCGEPKFEDNVFNTLINPLVVVEVLFETTESYDRGKKFENYRQIESLADFVLVCQDRALVEVYPRSDDGRWVLTAFKGLNEACRIESLDLEIPLAEIYREVNLPKISLAEEQAKLDGLRGK